MHRAVIVVVTTAALLAACSGSSDPEAPDTVPVTVEATVATTPASEVTVGDTTVEPETTPVVTEAPPATIDEAAILAEAEAACLEAFEVGKEALRNPDNPDNEALLEAHYTGESLEAVAENLRLTIDGNFIAVENPDNPSFAVVIEPAEVVDGDETLARMTVCEFNSDRIFEIGTAPDGGDALRRDDPVSILLVIRVEFVDGTWKSRSGSRGEEVRDEVEQCTAEL